MSINDDILNDCNLYRCKLNDCKVYLNYFDQPLIDVLNIMKTEISTKVDFYTLENEINILKMELAQKDKIINTLIAVLVQKEVITKTSIEDYIMSEKVMNKLCE